MFTLQKEQAGLVIVDVQEKLFSLTDRHEEVLRHMQKVIKGTQILKLPIIVTEQYPKGLGTTIPEITQLLPSNQEYWSKTSFSCLGDIEVNRKMLAMPIKQWIFIGIEAHVCIFLSARDLIRAGREVVVVSDAVTSRSFFNYVTAMDELRNCGARISSSETVLFELIQDSSDPSFKLMSQLFR